jgi:hypothetical protein
MIGSGVIFLDSMRMLVAGKAASDFDTLSLVTGSIWCAGAIAGLLGLIQLNVLGMNPVVKALGFVPIIGFAMLIVANILQVSGVYTTDTNTLAGIGWLVEMAGMVLVGILAIAAKTWTGWRRFIPLLTVVTAPLAFGLGSLIGNITLPVKLVYATWIILGYLVATTELRKSPARLATV